ncbi:hypothetical protein ACHAPT_011757 [Fusarium lateritium]
MSTSEWYPSSYWAPRWESASGAQVQETEVEPEKYNFLSFLATVQAYQIEILPIVWETGRGAIGTGGTSKIEQVLINLDTSFAFKTYHTRNQCERQIFRTLINEVTVLSQEFTREHDNIAQLQGICWDISPEDDRPWPVLVFEKSPLGDLYRFSRQEGRGMTVDERLWLCVDIGMAIRDMHDKQIVHGDIKPENVLVFANESGRHTARVIDFGYSSRYLGDDEHLSLPISAPWNAPENDGRLSGWTPSQAVKADFFCFGLLCVWLLSPCCHEGGTPGEAEAILRGVKDNIAVHTQQLLSQLAVREDIKEALRELFNSSLRQDPQERDDKCLFRFVHKLDPETANKHEILLTDLLEELGMRSTRFEIQDTSDQLYWTDYRVRAYIAQCLLNHPSPSVSTVSQAALCYHLGFGVARDEAKVQEMLAGSKQKQRLFKRIVSYLQHPRSAFGASTTRALQVMGFLGRSDFTNLYLEQGKLDEAAARLAQETSDLISACGADHALVEISKDMLSKVYSCQGRWEEAEKLEAEAMDKCKAQLGADHPDTLASMGNLATTLASQGRLVEAEKLTTEVVETCQAQLGADDILTLDNMANLASIIEQQGRGEEAEKLERQVMEIRRARLGEDHPDTLLSMSTLASALVRQGRFEEAEELDVKAMESRKARLGVSHPHTLTGMHNLSFVWKCQGRDAEALKLLEECVHSKQQVLGPEHPHALLSLSMLEQWREQMSSSPIDSAGME